MRKAFLFILSLSLITTLTVIISLSISHAYTLTRIANNSYHDGYPQINDNAYVVWREWDSSDCEIFLYNDSDENPLDAPLSGTGAAPNILVSPASLDFGNVNEGRSSAPSVITISNIGIADLHILDMTLWDTTNYSLNVNGGTVPCGSETPTITPNSSCTVTITFSPSSTGTIDARLVISSDDPDTPTVSISVSGRGTRPKCGCDFFPDTTVIQRGGTLGFAATVTNYTVGTWIFYFATKVTTPDGSWYPRSGYLRGPIKVTLRMSESKSKYLSLSIPSTVPLGTYTYHGYVGRAGYIWDECTFDFEVTE